MIFDPQNFTSPCRIAHGTVFYGTLHKYYYYNTATYSHILSAELSRSNEKDLNFFMISWQNLIFYISFKIRTGTHALMSNWNVHNRNYLLIQENNVVLILFLSKFSLMFRYLIYFPTLKKIHIYPITALLVLRLRE